MNDIKTAQLYDLSHTMAKELLSRCEYPWEALPDISETILALISELSSEDYYSPAPEVWVARSASVAPSATITGPAIIGPDSEVRVGAFIRGSVLVGRGCVVGNSCELKNCILFDEVQVPHFNYVGDSILGYRAHMGAGAVTSNVKADKSAVCIHTPEGDIAVAAKKVGAMLGDLAEIGCNCVLNPGTVIGKNSSVYPLSSVRGVVPSNSIYKAADSIVKKK